MTIDPFKKINLFYSFIIKFYEFSLYKISDHSMYVQSSLPKWYEATIKKLIK